MTLSIKECTTCNIQGMYNADQVRCDTCDTLLVPMSLIPTAELLALRADLADAKARAKTAEENWHKNEAKTGHMNNALTTCVMFLVNTNTITEEKQVELIKSLRMAGLVDLADSVSVGGFASVFEGVE